MNTLYTLGIRFYYLLICFLQLFNEKAKKWIIGRTKANTNWPKEIDNNNTYWFHCASLGEFDQGLPVMNEFKKRDPSLYIVVTFFSPSGMEHYHKRKHCADYVFYLPIDTPNNARKLIEHFKPKKIFFIKYEFWLNYIFEAKKKSIPTYSISSILRPNQVYFKGYGGLFRKGLKSMDTFFVQTKETEKLLNSIDIHNVVLTGDTRFDKVIENKSLAKQDETLNSFLKGEKALILGSSWKEEEEILEQMMNHSNIKQKIIIAPHDISETHLSQIELRFKGNIERYSNYTENKRCQILLIDSIGKLSNAYFYGEAAFIGGGFTGNLHNILEPVVFGLPVLFGPKHSKFPEAQQFIDLGIAFQIQTSEGLEAGLSLIKTNKKELEKKCIDTIHLSAGAANKIVDFMYKNAT